MKYGLLNKVGVVSCNIYDVSWMKMSFGGIKEKNNRELPHSQNFEIKKCVISGGKGLGIFFKRIFFLGVKLSFKIAFIWQNFRSKKLINFGVFLPKNLNKKSPVYLLESKRLYFREVMMIKLFEGMGRLKNNFCRIRANCVVWFYQLENPRENKLSSNNFHPFLSGVFLKENQFYLKTKFQRNY